MPRRNERRLIAVSTKRKSGNIFSLGLDTSANQWIARQRGNLAPLRGGLPSPLLIAFVRTDKLARASRASMLGGSFSCQALVAHIP